MGTASQRGLKSVGLFLFFGAAMTFLAGTLLIHPGTILYRAWRLTVVVMAAQLVGDLINFIRGDHLRGGLGFLIAGALLLYLVRRDVRIVFIRERLAIGR